MTSHGEGVHAACNPPLISMVGFLPPMLLLRSLPLVALPPNSRRKGHHACSGLSMHSYTIPLVPHSLLSGVKIEHLLPSLQPLTFGN